MAGSMANKGVSAMKTKIDQFQFIANSAGGHRHGQTTKSDIMFMTSDLAGRDADPGTFVDMHAAGSIADSA